MDFFPDERAGKAGWLTRTCVLVSDCEGMSKQSCAAAGLHMNMIIGQVVVMDLPEHQRCVEREE
jgi:hypothetical protein